MIFIALTGFFPEPNSDNSLQYQKNVPQALEAAVLNVMGWSSLRDVPMGEHELTANQAKEIMELVSTPYRGDLMYCMGLCSND
ncbi:pyocin S6 family toxin immunity protein [Pseudomonas lini]|uniref:Uncharacterized protein n=2 Tax=Pseudomonas lini TaxID=163011 RepID=A0A7V7NZ33_9PSED|nr:pyocin S6 family toxin immunity protein [Pseudomonas lini]KAB0497375.1 hypothetical protein F7R14_29010 [Pseudomonas lini]KMM93982.1 hypothetical protein TU81_05400 [Pseudomonas lini]